MAERADVQLVNDEVLDPGRDGEAGRELGRPEIVVAHLSGGRGRRLELLPHDVLVDDDAAAHRPVERIRVAVPARLRGVLVPATDLPARMDVRAVDDLALGVLDAEHVREADVPGEVAHGRTLPDAEGPRGEGDDRTRGVDARPVARDVTAVDLAEDRLDLPGVRGPYRESQVGRRGPARVRFLRAQVAAVREVIPLLARASRAREGDRAEALLRLAVVNLEVHRPRVRPPGAVEPHAPVPLRARFGVVEVDRGREGGAAVLRGDLRHRQLGPVVPAPGEPGVPEVPPLQAREVGESD